ncbi:MAG: hypothetical protein B6D63_01870 [Candidatus Latescibacteria bacterium 4484_7]|nr:MAG: hypothetical protein B6D63_01870 [Candidatus Latescibacteria bacterium 4484_7]
MGSKLDGCGMEHNRNSIDISKIAALGFMLVFLASTFPVGAFSADYQSVQLANGCHLRIYSPQELMGRMIVDSDGFSFIDLPDGNEYRVIDDMNDPIIVNKGDGHFHTADPRWVMEAIDRIDVGGATLDIDVNVFILPFPLYTSPHSFASGNNIYLSPGVYELDKNSVACTVTHEFGHVFQHRYLPLSDMEGWDGYRVLRGIDDEDVFNNDAPHPYRPVEIFAEDFRFLFGCDEARYSGTIENSSLSLPDTDPRVEQFFVGLVGSSSVASNSDGNPRTIELSNYPNPFNPQTTIMMRFPSNGLSEKRNVSLKIFDVSGRLVRDLFEGSIAGENLRVNWDGTDDSGRKVSSGAYFYRIEEGSSISVGKMLLIR